MDPRVTMALALTFGPPAEAPERHHEPPVVRKSAADLVDMSLTFSDGYRLAVRENKNFIIWVKYKCPSTAVQLPREDGYVHVFVDEYQGDSTQRVICGRPDGKGGLEKNPGNEGVVFADECCAVNIKEALKPPTRPASWGPAVMERRLPGPPEMTPAMRRAFSRARGMQSHGAGGACAT